MLSNADGFEYFERERDTLFGRCECAVTIQAFAGADVLVWLLFVDGGVHGGSCRCTRSFDSAAGPLWVTRMWYRGRLGG